MTRAALCLLLRDWMLADMVTQQKSAQARAFMSQGSACARQRFPSMDVHRFTQIRYGIRESKDKRVRPGSRSIL